MATIHHGDCIETMNAMPPESVDAIVTDPPYGLSNTDPGSVADTITKWAGGDRDHVPAGRGFMGKSWDAFVPPPAVWDECLRVLKPGGHMVVFAGSRTHDLMGLSIRLAGFEIRDSMAWLYGSGFPKSHNVGKSTGDERYAGHGTALKPAFEPIVLARKPLAEKTVARNVLAHGTGAINVDACRIAGDMSGGNWVGTQTAPIGYHGGTAGSGYQGQQPSGRWPANVLLDQHAAAWVDEQSGHQKDGVAVNRNRDPEAVKHASIYGMYRNGTRDDIGYGGGGGASRFFYTAKAPKSERPNVDGVQHPTVKPLAIMRWLIRLVTPPGGTVLDPFAGSGPTIEAALIEGFNPVGIEMEPDYLPLIQHRIDRATPHPTHASETRHDY